METSDSHPIASLEHRLASLELLTAPGSSSQAHPLVQALAGVNAKLKSAVDGRPALADLLKKAPQINSVLDARLESELSLPLQAKAEVVLASEATIARTAGLLQELEALATVVDSEKFESTVALAEKEGARAELVHANNTTAAKAIEQQFLEILANYNALVSLLSAQFVEWDRILATAESTVADLEKRKAQR